MHKGAKSRTPFVRTSIIGENKYGFNNTGMSIRLK